MEGSAADVSNIITVDIGGTSADIAAIVNGEVKVKNPRDTEVGGYPVMAPMIDLVTIGAGGGSIARVDEFGAFHVGPKSAGSMPGPACYGRGGLEPTVTDAHIVLGRLDPTRHWMVVWRFAAIWRKKQFLKNCTTTWYFCSGSSSGHHSCH